MNEKDTPKKLRQTIEWRCFQLQTIVFRNTGTIPIHTVNMKCLAKEPFFNADSQSSLSISRKARVSGSNEVGSMGLTAIARQPQ